jgi:hypothetical protein
MEQAAGERDAITLAPLVGAARQRLAAALEALKAL